MSKKVVEKDNLVVLNVTKTVLRKFAEEKFRNFQFGDDKGTVDKERVARFMKRNKVEEFRVPEYGKMLAFAADMKRVAEDVLESAQNLLDQATDFEDELNNTRYLDLQDLDNLSDLNGEIVNILSEYQSTVQTAVNHFGGSSRSGLKSIAYKVGARWFVKWFATTKQSQNR